MCRLLPPQGCTFALVLLCLVLAGCGGETADGMSHAAPAELAGVVHLPEGRAGATDPTLVSATGGSSVADTAPVYGLVLGADARAYRLSTLTIQHVVNERFGDLPVAITYCTISATAASYEARVEGHPRLTFTSGARCWRGTMLMRDDQTLSTWRQLDGLCIDGPLRGRRLWHVDAGRLARWDAWRTAHPTTRIMAVQDEKAEAQLELLLKDSGGFDVPECVLETIPAPDGRLANDALVYGVQASGEVRAYALRHLAETRVTQDTVGGVPVTLWYVPDAPTAVAYDRRLQGATLSFERRDGAIVDLETGSRWNLDGRCVSGRHAGRQLTRVWGARARYYAWRLVFPSSGLQP